MTKKIAFLFFTALLTLGISSGTVLARPPIIPAGTDLVIPHQTDTSVSPEQDFGGRLLPTITQVVIGATGGCSILFIIIGAIQILTAYGNDEKIGSAKKTITFALVGLIISMLSYAIVSIISAVNLN